MKKLVLTVVIAAATSQAAGCIISSDDTGDDGGNPVIIADLQLSNAGPGNLVCINSPTDPRGRDGIRINARLLGTQSGDQFLFDCTAVGANGMGQVTTQETAFGYDAYEVWVDYINDRGFPQDPSQWVVVDSTIPVTVDVSDGSDIHAIVDLEVGNGFFNSAFALEDGTPQHNPVPCPPNGTVTVDATISGTSTLFDDEFLCTDGANDPNGVYSDEAMPLDDYTIAAQLFDSQQNPQSAVSTANASIIDGNEYVPLNVVLVVN